MKKVLFSLLALVTLLIDFGCKKGEEDPLISFRSRKNKVEGVWKVVKMHEEMDVSYTPYGYYNMKWKEKTEIYGSSATFTSNFFDGENRIGLVTDYSYTFTKEGTWTHLKNIKWIEVIVKDTTEIYSQIKSSGTWDFLGGIGEDKNKQSMVLNIENEVFTENRKYKFGEVFEETLITQREYSYVGDKWDLIRLTNKEIIVDVVYKDMRMSSFNEDQNGTNYNFSGKKSMTLNKE